MGVRTRRGQGWVAPVRLPPNQEWVEEPDFTKTNLINFSPGVAHCGGFHRAGSNESVSGGMSNSRWGLIMPARCNPSEKCRENLVKEVQTTNPCNSFERGDRQDARDP